MCLFIYAVLPRRGNEFTVSSGLILSRDQIEASQRVAPRKTLQRLKKTLDGATVDHVLLTAG